MFMSHRSPTFETVVDQVYRAYFGKFGILGITGDERGATINLLVDDSPKHNLSAAIVTEIENAAKPYKLIVLREPAARALG